MSDFEDPAEPEAPAPERRTVEAWRDAKGTVAWLFAGARAGERWPVGRELTETEYDAAIHRAGNVQLS